MTDKQIINGVSVGWCMNYNAANSKDCETLYICAENPNCYYKQLKRAEKTMQEIWDRLGKTSDELLRKEQECERLNKELHKNFEEKDTLHLIIDRLLEASGYDTNTASAEDFEDIYEHMRYEQQQLDQLKAENENWQKEYWKLEQGNDFWAEKNSRLRGCLTEIKEIAEICKCHNADGCYECKYFYDCEVEDEEIPTRDVCKLILQKISECEE